MAAKTVNDRLSFFYLPMSSGTGTLRLWFRENHALLLVFDVWNVVYREVTSS